MSSREAIVRGIVVLVLAGTLASCGSCPAEPAEPPAPSFYSVANSVSIPGPGDPPGISTLTTEASCQPGDRVVGGGIAHAVMGPNSNIDQITSAPNPTDTGWVGLIARIMGAGTTLEVTAICADLTP